MKWGFFTREALRSMGRNAAPSFAAMATVLVTLIVLGVFIPIVQATTGAANDVRKRVLVDVYLKAGATRADRDRVASQIKQAPYVGKVEFVSKQQAYAEQKRRDPQAYALLGANPLPDTFRVTPSNPDDAGRLKAALGGARPIDPSIDEVRDSKRQAGKILEATRFVKLTVGALAALLIIASILLIANTIRLSLFARRREVEVMKLVGATDWFIRWPFVIEGVICGACGAVLAILVLLVAKVALLDPLANDFALIAAPDTLPFGLLVAILVGAGIAVSALGSGLSLRRFLQV